MANLNEVRIIGRLGKDPILETSNGGYTNTMLSVAVDLPKKNNDGSWNQNTQWLYPRVWRDKANYLVDIGQKGALVLIIGQLKGEWYQDGQNQKYRLDLNVKNIQILSGGRVNPQNTQHPPQQQNPPQNQQPPQNQNQQPPQQQQTPQNQQYRPNYDEPPF